MYLLKFHSAALLGGSQWPLILPLTRFIPILSLFIHPPFLPRHEDPHIALPFNPSFYSFSLYIYLSSNPSRLPSSRLLAVAESIKLKPFRGRGSETNYWVQVNIELISQVMQEIPPSEKYEREKWMYCRRRGRRKKQRKITEEQEREGC